MLNMFRASQRQLLRATPNLNLKLHQPLPLDARQSEKLLNLLTTSFRKHLDKEHGGPEFDPTIGSKEPKPEAKPIVNNHAPRPDIHMKRLLANPHFRPLDGSSSKTVDIGDPMVVFEAAVAKGMMNISNASHCLYAKKSRIIESTVLDIRDAMRDSKAGTTVLKWLISSGHANNLDFLRDDKFCAILMQFMVAEGLQDACWSWIRKSLRNVPRIFELPLRSEARYRLKVDIMTPLFSYVMALSARPAPLDDAYTALVKAAGYLQGLSNAQAQEALGYSLINIIGVTKTTLRDRPPPSEPAFDAFLRLLPVSRPFFEYDLAHLGMMHPTRPSPDYALELLREVHRHGSPKLPHRTARTVVFQAELEVRIMHLGLDTAKFLLKLDRYVEALEIMDCLRLHFPVQLGLDPKHIQKLEDEEAEASTLEMLDRLSVA